MLSEREMWATAGILIADFGDYADREAVRRAEAFRKTGDRREAATWRRIHKVVLRLQQTAPRRGEKIH